ncbi:MAG: tetratricopeptide repeat protein [Candidatus Hydrogenedentota bacterium]
MKKFSMIFIMIISLLLSKQVSTEELNININYPDAIMALEDAVKEAPLNFSLKYDLVTLYIEWGKNVALRKEYALNKALQILDGMLYSRPDSIRTHLLRIEVYTVLGDKEKIYSACKELLSYYPDHLPTLRLASKTGKEINKPYNIHLQKILDINPIDSEAKRELEIYETSLKTKTSVTKKQEKTVFSKMASEEVIKKEHIVIKEQRLSSVTLAACYKLASEKKYLYNVNVTINKSSVLNADYSIIIKNILKNSADAKISITGMKPDELFDNFEVDIPFNGQLKTLPLNIQKSFIQYIFLPLPVEIAGKQPVKGVMYLPSIDTSSEIQLDYNFSLVKDENINFDCELHFKDLPAEALCEGEARGIFNKDDFLLKELDCSIWLTLVKEGKEEEIEINIKINKKE